MSRTYAFFMGHSSRICRVGGVALIGAVGTVLLGCSGADGSAAADSVDQERSLTVFAAASLHETFTALAESFEAENSGVSVELNLAGSSDLVAQISEGAPADVIATADETTMERLIAHDDLAEEPVIFAQNTLTIVTAPGNPAEITSLEDLADDSLDLVLCAPQVPCGQASETLLARADVEVAPVSEERQVTDVLGKVTSGQADAGLVYVTDAAGAGEDVESVEIEHSDEVVNRYPIGVLDDAEDPELADAFLAHVTSEQGRAALAEDGFALPEPTS